ncbi:MAG: biotin/lipoyl-containing protein, partial [Vicinamibacterales bacterium]
MTDLVLPNLGDGVAQGDVLKVLVKPGDPLKVDQPELELETDKATIEVPSTLAG